MAMRAFGPLDSPDFKISAHAVPSGNGSFPCSFTIMYRRIGIMKRTPKIPPSDARTKILIGEIVSPKRKSAGTVKTTPPANPSPTEAMFWTRLFSKMVTFLKKERGGAGGGAAAGGGAGAGGPAGGARE